MPVFKPLHSLFGATVSAVDLTAPVSDQDFSEIYAAFEKYSLLVFHDQALSDDAQLAFSRRFGPLELTKIGAPGAGTEMVILSNIGPDGEIAAAEDRMHGSHRANSLWHTDSSFKKIPAKASLLSGRTVPPSGGETEFVSMRAAYAALPEATKQKIDGRVALHSFAHSRDKIYKGLATDVEQDVLPAVPQPMVTVNPTTGEKSFYVASHASHIEGVPVEEGAALIAELVEFATQPDRVYRHEWRDNDLVIWDNRCLLHRAQPFENLTHRRHMIRTTVSIVDAAA
ncbi:MAG: TauD/TfdA dioxygenase family protein [Alphaproteobacteria bacterium]|jgi:alpha-ketoglutarate-dependent 2,4-dichlorophenoxyacetate dioxygenase